MKNMASIGLASAMIIAALPAQVRSQQIYCNLDFAQQTVEQMRLAQGNSAAIQREEACKENIERQQAQAQEQADQEAEYRRTHPREYAAQLAAQQAQARRQAAIQQRQKLVEQAQEHRKAAACEEHGGTWGYRGDDVYQMNLGCFFQTAN